MIESPDRSLPDLTIPRRDVLATIDLTRYRIPHPRPYLLSLRTSPAHGSRAVSHVSNIEYVRWIDRAAELHSDALGFTRTAMIQTNRMWFVARHEINYRAEAGLDDDLIIATWVRDFRRVKSWRDFVLFRPSDQTIVCDASTLWVLVDLDTRRPTRVPSEMAAAFDPLHHPTSPPLTAPH